MTKGFLFLGFMAGLLLTGCQTISSQTTASSVPPWAQDYFSECAQWASLESQHTAEDLVGSSLTTFEQSTRGRVVYVDDKILSYVVEFEEYTGGAHGMRVVKGGSICRKSGAPLTLDQVIPADRHPALKVALHRAVVQRLGSEDSLLDAVFIPYNNFYIAADGIHFIFNVYEVACYAAGMLDIVIDPATL